MRYAILILALALGGCSYTLPSGEKVHRDVYRMKHNDQRLETAINADAEKFEKLALIKPEGDCNAAGSTANYAICVLGQVNYNLQMSQVRADTENYVQIAAALSDREADEREQKWDRGFAIFDRALRLYEIDKRASGGGTGTRINVSGHTIKGSGGAGGSGEAGGAGSGHSAGDQNVTVVVGDNNQSGSGAGTYSPVLEYATQMGSTRPVWSEGAQDNRSTSDDASLLNGGIF